MDKRNERPFSPIHVIMLLISCLTVMGCYNPDWSNKDADFLITQLKNNRHYQLREKAIYLLASKGQERDKVIPALTHALLNDEYGLVQAAAADALGSIEPPAVSAIPALIEALQRELTGHASLRSNELNVHEEAITSLGKMGPDAAEAIPALLEFFRGERGYWTERRFWDDAGLAILKIDSSMHTVKEELVERRAVYPLAELAEAGDVSLIPVLIQLLNDPDPPYRAAEALKNIGTPEALDAAVVYYTQRLDSKVPWVRSDAAEALKDIGTPEALEALEAAVPAFIQELNNPDASERLRAARALKDIGTPEALDAAMSALIQLLNAPEAEDRERAAKVLKDIGTPEALDAVKQFEKRRWWPF